MEYRMEFGYREAATFVRVVLTIFFVTRRIHIS